MLCLHSKQMQSQSTGPRPYPAFRNSSLSQTIIVRYQDILWGSSSVSIIHIITSPMQCHVISIGPTSKHPRFIRANLPSISKSHIKLTPSPCIGVRPAPAPHLDLGEGTCDVIAPSRAASDLHHLSQPRPSAVAIAVIRSGSLLWLSK